MAKNNTSIEIPATSGDKSKEVLFSPKRILVSILLFLLTGYQRYISPLFAPHCRFYPSCSEYAKQAITEHGTLSGSLMATKRILRCNPLFEGGPDPVPPACPNRNH